MSPIQIMKMTNFRWVVCGMLFFATCINYMDRQVLSLTWKDFLSPEFGWTEEHYGYITAIFSLSYALFMFFAGKVMDMMGARWGYVLAVTLWSFGAILHAFCGIVTCGLLTGHWLFSFDGSWELLHDYNVATLAITTCSMYLFLVCRLIFSLGISANFPVAIKVTTEYFPKKDRAFATAIFNSGACVGALIAPITIPYLANRFGWEVAYLIVGAVGYIWVFVWLLYYHLPKNNPRVNQPELEYILQDYSTRVVDTIVRRRLMKLGFWNSLRYRQMWAMIIGKFTTDGLWWYILFWVPVYISDNYNYSMDSPMGMAMVFAIYLISMLSIGGGYLPTYFMDRYMLSPYHGRMRAMLFFALMQLLGLLVVPAGDFSPWVVVVLLGIQGAAHQSFSANLYSMAGDFFPKRVIATVTSIGSLFGGVASSIAMMSSGALVVYAHEAGETFGFLGFYGKEAAYMIMFTALSLSYILGWALMKLLVPNDTTIEDVIKKEVLRHQKS